MPSPIFLHLPHSSEASKVAMVRDRYVDPQTRDLLERLGAPEAGGDPSLQELREPWPEDDPALLPRRPLPGASDLLVPGDPTVPVRVYTPATPAPRAALVWLHPGGFVAGSIDDIDGICRTLAIDGGCTVVSVAYRLAPENPFPAALDDVTLVLSWLRDNAAMLGIDAFRIAIGGQSAGANLAAACTLRLRERGADLPAFQVLAYPVLDPSTGAPSYRVNDERFALTTRHLRWCWAQYLGDLQVVPPETAPLLADDLGGLPAALIVGAGLDPARDDSRRYADRLAASGVDTQFVEFEGTIHAFLSFAGVLDVGTEALSLISQALRVRLATSSPRLQHVTLPYEPGREDEVRGFYAGLLGIREKPVPAAFAGRGFIWFAAGPDEAELHLIPEVPEQTSSERHACFSTERLDETVAALREAGHEVDHYDLIPPRSQAFVHDPCGNLLELTTLMPSSDLKELSGDRRERPV
jgi:acetyl esterase